MVFQDVLTAQRLLLQQREGGCVDCSPLLPDLTVDTDGDRDDEAECYWNGSVSHCSSAVLFYPFMFFIC